MGASGTRSHRELRARGACQGEVLSVEVCPRGRDLPASRGHQDAADRNVQPEADHDRQTQPDNQDPSAGHVRVSIFG
jgi:hypothetical protein